MSPRQRKSFVKPETRREWLEQSEDGHSPPEIAKAEGVDPRTVRKHISIAMHEKETKDARSTVLRNALERHYDQLCRCAERLVQQTTSDAKINIDALSPNTNEINPYESQLKIALRQHIPKSPLWKLLSEEAKLRVRVEEFTQPFNKKIETSISSDPRLTSQLTNEENAVVRGIVEALTHQARFWVKGSSTLNPNDNLKSEPAEEGFVNLKYGAFNLGKVKKENVELIRKTISDWTARAQEWKEFDELKKAESDLRRVHQNLNDEIAVISLRHVLPGRCKYCPL